MFLGIDTGGTFTDFVFYDGKVLRVHKVLSTPANPEQAILQGIGDLAVSMADLHIVHGSTVATNAVLEGKGVPTVYITNRGLKDVLTIGRQTRQSLYELQPEPQAAPVPEAYCLETGGRLAADGAVVEQLTDGDIEALQKSIAELNPKAVAINLLFSFLDDQFERAIEAALPSDVFVSRSSKVLPVYREYERGIATWLNAWVGPLVQGYLQRLSQAVKPANVAVMQSSGGSMAAEEAGQLAVHLLLSGPAGGVAGAKYLGRLAGKNKLLSFDMGGTSTDVALIDGDIKLTDQGRISHYPVAVPMVDMHTVGAGGGSVARVDEGGLLLVGPESAGASPGPACYGQGGEQATVTDANVVLGRIPPQTRLAGSMPIDADLSRQAVTALAEKLNMSCEQAALGIIRVVNEHMAQAAKLISVQRGHNPSQFTLVSFGGAGGLHVCELADSLSMREAMVPIHSGVLSALGMLVAPPERQLSHTYLGLLQDMQVQVLEQRFAEMESIAIDALRSENLATAHIDMLRYADLRYQGQTHCLSLAWKNIQQALDDFPREHERQYGHRLQLPVELVNLKVTARAKTQPLDWQLATRGGAKPAEFVTLYGERDAVPCWQREQLIDTEIMGPALVADSHATTYIAKGWRCKGDLRGNLLLTR